jgi:tyrosyl-tRNA synthetase
LDKDTIFQNAERFKEQMGRIIDFTDNKAMFIKNGDWLLDLNYIEFLRDIGRHFSVNKMLSAECYKARLETGLSFLEFNYMLLQSYDFWYLFKNHNVKMQFGGDDQWSNLLGGIDLIRKMEQASAYAMTFPLLTTKDGKKMGKTQKGALWLDGAKCPPYEFYQYWRNVMDEDVIRMMKIFTFIPVEEIEEIEKTQAITDINGVKERFAFEITKIIHGEEEARKAMDAARGAFTSGNSENLPKTVLDASDFTDNAIHILDLLVKTGLAPSKREARTLVAQGGILIDGEKVDDPNAQITIETEVVIKKGKKVFHKAVRNA